MDSGIQVVFVSANDGVEAVLKGNAIGTDYLLKPVCYEELKFIWKHVVKKDNSKKISPKKETINPNPVRSLKWHTDNITEREAKGEAEVNQENKKLLPKKQRLNWSKEMHTKFLMAIEKLGIQNAVPKKILEIMNEPMLSRENVASHLQKHRNNLRKEMEIAKHKFQEVETAINYIHWPNSNDQGTGFSLLPKKYTKMENNHYRSFSHFSGGYDPNEGQIPMPPPTNSIPMLPPNRSYGPNQLPDLTHPNQMVQPSDPRGIRPSNFSYGQHQMFGLIESSEMARPNNSLPMLLPSFPYGPIQMPISTQWTQMDQATNFEPMLPPSSSRGPNQMRGLTESDQIVHDANSLLMPPPRPSREGLGQIRGSAQSTQMSQPANMPPIVPPSFTCGPSQLHDSTDQSTEIAQPTDSVHISELSSSNGNLEGRNISDMMEQSTECINWDLAYLDETFKNSDVARLILSPSEDDLEDDLLALLDDNSGPTL